MDKNQLLLNLAGDLKALADSVKAAVDAMKQSERETESEIPTEEPQTAESEPEKTITLEEVRAALASLSRDGYTDRVRMLIRKYGGERLGEIDPNCFADLLKEAEELNDAPC